MRACVLACFFFMGHAPARVVAAAAVAVAAAAVVSVPNKDARATGQGVAARDRVGWLWSRYFFFS